MMGAVSKGGGNVAGERVYPLQDRLSGVIRNPKALRPSIVLYSIGGYPELSRSAEDGASPSPQYWGVGVTQSPIVPTPLLTPRYGRFMRYPNRPSGVPLYALGKRPYKRKLSGNPCATAVGERNMT